MLLMTLVVSRCFGQVQSAKDIEWGDNVMSEQCPNHNTKANHKISCNGSCNTKKNP